MQNNTENPEPKVRERPLRIVLIGGGTGLSAPLHGLKPYARHLGTQRVPVVDVTAIVTVADDGGSTGRLRQEFKVQAPGDIRNCMVALSEDEALLSRLFQYRFATGRGLKGHSFGNLFLTALTDITGDFAQAVKVSSEVLASAGRIFPSTAHNVVLEAKLADGKVVRGETRISKSRSRIETISLHPDKCQPLPETLEAIAAADLIMLGPGSLFTSVIPNLLVEGIPDAIQASRAVTACFVNLMWQPGETVRFTAADHVEAINRHAGRRLVDVAVVNTCPIGGEMLERYAKQRAQPVENDIDRLRDLGVEVVGAELVEETGTVRHNPAAIAAVALELARRARNAQIEKNATTNV